MSLKGYKAQPVWSVVAMTWAVTTCRLTPSSRGQLKSKGHGKLSIHFAADQDTPDTIYRIILSVNQLSIYGAVAAIYEEFEDHQDRTGEPVNSDGSITCSR